MYRSKLDMSWVGYMDSTFMDCKRLIYSFPFHDNVTEPREVYDPKVCSYFWLLFFDCASLPPQLCSPRGFFPSPHVFAGFLILCVASIIQANEIINNFGQQVSLFPLRHSGDWWSCLCLRKHFLLVHVGGSAHLAPKHSTNYHSDFYLLHLLLFKSVC